MIIIIVCPWFNGKLVESYSSYYVDSKDSGYVFCESNKEDSSSYVIQSYDDEYDDGYIVSIDTDNNYTFDIHTKVGVKISRKQTGNDAADTYYIENNGSEVYLKNQKSLESIFLLSALDENHQKELFEKLKKTCFNSYFFVDDVTCVK